VSKYVEFPLEGGGSIVIESADEPGRAGTGFVRGGEAGQVTADAASQSFDASVEAVRRSADLLVGKLRSLGNVPDEMVVAFALKASSDLGGLAVAKGGDDANFHVTLKAVGFADLTVLEAADMAARRLSRLGVDDALVEAGAVAGDEVRIGDIAFEFSLDEEEE
jgi:Obg family GTPase CgtA-like protein